MKDLALYGSIIGLICSIAISGVFALVGKFLASRYIKINDDRHDKAQDNLEEKYNKTEVEISKLSKTLSEVKGSLDVNIALFNEFKSIKPDIEANRDNIIKILNLSETFSRDIDESHKKLRNLERKFEVNKDSISDINSKLSLNEKDVDESHRKLRNLEEETKQLPTLYARVKSIDSKINTIHDFLQNK